ncbi:hypothetical protein FHL15_000445 [Xylaria flabelliformis]|uniref:Uncharacterized protein n=1 Tax=Xylaria flabelliformis TaxID=2512241 RepID=A0A553IFX7_9PEZI|nr:hypothetical protein FHL15_000445 [Xylaria flabelliformis]
MTNGQKTIRSGHLGGCVPTTPVLQYRRNWSPSQGVVMICWHVDDQIPSSKLSGDSVNMDVVFPPLAFGPDGYSLTVDGRGSVPKMFREMRIGSIYVEFLRLDSSDTPARLRNLLKNHAIIKVDFTFPYGNTENDRYDGARINLQTKVEISDGPYQPGELFVKPARYPAASYSTARTCRIDLQQNITLDHLLWVIESNNLQYFSFVVLNHKYYGCRDFVI